MFNTEKYFWFDNETLNHRSKEKKYIDIHFFLQGWILPSSVQHAPQLLCSRSPGTAISCESFRPKDPITKNNLRLLYHDTALNCNVLA